MTFPDIDALLAYATLWAQCSVKSTASFTGSSDDGGRLSLRTSDRQEFGEDHYSVITIMTIEIPENRKRQGLYSRFLETLDNTVSYGVRYHAATGADWLADRHRRHGYVEVNNGRVAPSFYKIVGEPTILSDEEKCLHRDLQSRMESYFTGKRIRSCSKDSR